MPFKGMRENTDRISMDLQDPPKRVSVSLLGLMMAISMAVSVSVSVTVALVIALRC